MSALHPLGAVPARERRERLLDLIRREAYMEGDFTLSSGAKSSFYLDCRLVTLHPVGALLVGTFVVQEMKRLGVTCVGGPTLAADPIVGAAVGLSPLMEWPVDGFIVRKAAKEHGTGKLIEGRLPENADVLMVEDVITSAGSVIHAIEAVRERGCNVKAVWALVDRQAGGVQAIQDLGIEVRPMFTLEEVQAARPEGDDSRRSVAPWDRHWKPSSGSGAGEARSDG
ncbi:MAG: orotate phosphoribosyltransferase [Armatimonadota bacterium]